MRQDRRGGALVFVGALWEFLPRWSARC